MSSQNDSFSTKVLTSQTAGDDSECEISTSLCLLCCYSTETCCSVQHGINIERDSEENSHRELHTEECADRNALIKSFSPLFTSMKIFGVYFNVDDNESHVATPDTTDKVLLPDTMQYDQKPRNNRWNYGKIYGATVLVLQWLNVIRLVTRFSSSDKFEARLTYKLVALAQALLCATMHTSYFIACSTGRLNGVLRDIQVSMKVCTSMRKRAILLTVLVWILIVEHMCVFIFFLLFNFEKFDYLVAPFDNIIMINSSIQLINSR